MIITSYIALGLIGLIIVCMLTYAWHTKGLGYQRDDDMSDMAYRLGRLEGLSAQRPSEAVPDYVPPEWC